MSLKCLQESDYIDVLASWNGREKKIYEIKVLCEQTRKLTDDLHDFWIIFNVIWFREFCGWLSYSEYEQ